MTVQSDLDINRSVRRIMVKHWIDLGRVSIRSTKGRLLIRGRLLRIAGRAEPLTTPIVEAMFTEIGRQRGVRNVMTHLENWIKDGGRWREQERHGHQVDQRDSVKSGGSITLE